MKKRTRKTTAVTGGLLGAALAIAAGIFLMSKPGEKLRKDIKKQAALFYKQLAPQLKKVQKMGEAEYKAFLKSALKKYSKARKLSQADEKAILREVKQSWRQFKKQLS